MKVGMNFMKISAVILAGGKGKRMKSDVSKQFIMLKGKPILYYTLDKFIRNDKIDNIVLVLPQNEIEYCMKNIIEKYRLKVDYIVSGGVERQDSVYNGLKALNDTDIVLIHDGARPFVSDKIIEEGIENAIKFGGAAPGVMPKDTIKVKDNESFSKQTLDRSTLVAIQTPQVFRFSEIKECHEKVKQDNIAVTDDTMVYEMYGNKVYLYDGDYENIKITTPEDLLLGERILSKI